VTTFNKWLCRYEPGNSCPNNYNAHDGRAQTLTNFVNPQDQFAWFGIQLSAANALGENDGLRGEAKLSGSYLSVSSGFQDGCSMGSEGLLCVSRTGPKTL
jgi:hypothetical protein